MNIRYNFDSCTRLEGKMTVLSKERKKILEIIHKNPQSIGEIRHMMDTVTGWGNIYYHLGILERFKYVSSKRVEIDAVSKLDARKMTTLYTLTEKGKKTIVNKTSL